MKVGLAIGAVLVALLAGSLTGGVLTATGEEPPAPAPQVRLDDDESPGGNPAARAFVTAKKTWTACVAKAAPDRDSEGGRFAPRAGVRHQAPPARLHGQARRQARPSAPRGPRSAGLGGWTRSAYGGASGSRHRRPAARLGVSADAAPLGSSHHSPARPRPASPRASMIRTPATDFGLRPPCARRGPCRASRSCCRARPAGRTSGRPRVPSSG